MDSVAKRYVECVLAVGQHDPNYVDAYYGPEELKPSEEIPLAQIRGRAEAALAEAQGSNEPRGKFLATQLRAVIARIDMLSGVTFSFDEEAAALYDIRDTGRPESHYTKILSGLADALPGSGALAERYDAFRSQFYVPRERLEAVFSTAVDAARAETKRHIELPANESFRLEYVSGEVWSAYNWYQGNSQSLIQLNTDFPLTIDRPLHLACHEGYPGHHVYNALLEQHLVRDRGWLEFTVYPLYSPQSLIAEGTAEYGFELAFSPEERSAFERESLYPLAGLDPSRAEEYRHILDLVEGLGYASTDVGRRYLNGEISRDEAVDWLVTFGLSSRDRAQQRVRFIEAHRSYVVTYVLGQSLVKDHVERNQDRWKTFTEVLSEPVTPGMLGSGTQSVEDSRPLP